MSYKIGFDIGSTTLKAVVLNEADEICYKSYERHKARVRQKALEKLLELEEYTKNPFYFAISGSGALGLCEENEIPFVQEVFASASAIHRFYPKIDCAIELGGEDAKVLFFDGSIEQRMNSTCAGGTGAFIDQMASLLGLSLEEMNEKSLHYDQLYPIASRCGVFAKSDIQPLINQGVSKENLSASIFQAVVDQTITSLAQGRELKGNALFLGGPLYFLSGLRSLFQKRCSFDSVVCPDTAIHFVAFGTALCADTLFSRNQLVSILTKLVQVPNHSTNALPLFNDETEYKSFMQRHSLNDVRYKLLEDYDGDAYLGIDSGSTTTKLVLLSDKNEILYQSYSSNKGDPLQVVHRDLCTIYKMNPRIKICGAYATGYGENLMCQAFQLDGGIVETIAHYTAACLFNPNVDYILDIGGQDIKCFKILDGKIEDIVLNEACSSGCGSFIETFANSLGYDSLQFSKLALRSKNPVDLGTRCTVFMNSGVKQAQKNGAKIEDIAAGLCKSVVKNALYKVIRAKNIEDIGRQIVVQGGTFQNDAILRCFELEIGQEVIRPSVSHLMGAFGAALYAKKMGCKRSSILGYEDLKKFSHSSTSTACRGCSNHCSLTINSFSNGSKCIAGNKCDKMVADKHNPYFDFPNLYKEKREMLLVETKKYHHKDKIGIPFILNIYDLLPFWTCFFDCLGYEVIFSQPSTLAQYHEGQSTIPSDTECFPAKLVHGHIKDLCEKGVSVIFYPCMTYNVDEHQSDNHYNCPLVAYYSQVIQANMDLEGVRYIAPFISFDNVNSFVRNMNISFASQGINFDKKKIKQAFKVAYINYQQFHEKIISKHIDAVSYARAHDLPIAVLCGRPYHLDPLVNHSIDTLLTQLGFVVVSEESVPRHEPVQVDVLNQWTYHARLYQAAQYVCENDDMTLIQLVSFGCGIDSITTDEVRDILKKKHKLYTQIKIDEVDNQGAIKIRLRSLKSAIELRKKAF